MRRCLGFLAGLTWLLCGGVHLLWASDLLPPELPVTEAIDFYIDARLRDANATAAPQATNPQLIRRLTLDLAGRIPTLAESQVYAADSRSDKRVHWVDRLIASPDFAYHQRNEFDNMLLPNGRDEAWRAYLLRAFRDNRSWDSLFRDMMLGQEDSADKPALAFLRSRAQNLDDLTNDTSKLFFGVSINCAKCHDHPLVLDWTQDHYFGFSSFFNRTYLNKRNQLGERDEGLVKFKTKDGVDKEAKLLFLSGTIVEEPDAPDMTEDVRKALAARRKSEDDKKEGPPPPMPEFSRRAQLVELALRSEDNRFFSRSIVNRVWARLMGRGFVMPLDQMHSENPPSHPELLDWLARDLVTHGYDLRRLIRGIVLSQAYSRGSQRDSSGAAPARELLAVAVLRPLSPAQYAASLMLASRNPDSFVSDPTSDDWSERRERLETDATRFAGQFEIPGENFQVSVDEALLFSNGPQVQNDFLSNASDRLIGKLLTISDSHERIRVAFRTVLSREPEQEELDSFGKYLEARPDRALSALRQAVWSLLTSSEFRFNY